MPATRMLVLAAATFASVVALVAMATLGVALDAATGTPTQPQPQVQAHNLQMQVQMQVHQHHGRHPSNDQHTTTAAAAAAVPLYSYCRFCSAMSTVGVVLVAVTTMLLHWLYVLAHK